MRILRSLLTLLVLFGSGIGQEVPYISPVFEDPEFLTEAKNNNSAGYPLLDQKTYNVLDYNIQLSVIPDSQLIRGMTEIKWAAQTIIENELIFDFSEMHLDSVLLDGIAVQSDIMGEQIIIQLPVTIAAGDTHFVKIFYNGTPKRGLYFRSNLYNDQIVYTHNEPYDAHYWFPCKDDPSDKATMSMTVTVPEQYLVLSNGVLVTEIDTIGHKTSFWREDYPIATYLISMVTGPYIILNMWNDLDIPLQYYIYPQDLDRGEAALHATREMLHFYSEWIGEYPFMFDKYAMSEVPMREAAAMENQTATTMSDRVMDNEEIIAHELAHQWWGNAVTPVSFAEIWLNEGFATYFDALFTEYQYGEEAFQLRLDNFRGQMTADGSLEFPIYNPPPEYMFGRAVYLKGAWVLHMMRQQIGDLLFQQIFRDYFEEYKYKNVVTADFISLTNEVSGRDLSSFFSQWLNYGGLPLIIGDWQQLNNSVSISLRQEQIEPVYHLNLEVLLRGFEKDTLLMIPVVRKDIQFEIEFNDIVRQLIIDPNNKVLTTNNSPVYHVPKQSSITKIHPNPFQNDAVITYSLIKNQEVEILIYNILGEAVETLEKKRQNVGLHQTVWSAGNYASGIYFCVLKHEQGADMRKIMLIK